MLQIFGTIIGVHFSNLNNIRRFKYLEQNRNYSSQHKLLSVGVILYIVVFILSKFISPWQIDGEVVVQVFDKEIDMSSSAQKFLFYGIYDLLEVTAYADSESSSNAGLTFGVICLMLFSLVNLLFSKFFETNDNLEKPEKMAVSYLYDNVLAYIICIISYFIYQPFDRLLVNIFFTSNKKMIFITAIIIMGMIILAFLQVVKIAVYVLGIELLKYLTVFLNGLILNKLIYSIVSFVLTIFMIILINIIVDKITDIVSGFLGSFRSE